MEVVFLGILFATAIFLLFNFESDDTEYEKRKEKKKKKEKSFYTYDDDNYWYDKDDSRKIEKIFNLIVKDFNNSPYNDEYEVKTISSLDYISFIYKFDNGYTFNMINNPGKEEGHGTRWITREFYYNNLLKWNKDKIREEKLDELGI